MSQMVRGGGWNYDVGYCRSAHRDLDSPNYCGSFLGFRLAKHWDEFHEVRGGAFWNSIWENGRTAHRNEIKTNDRHYSLSFRIARRKG